MPENKDEINIKLCPLINPILEPSAFSDLKLPQGTIRSFQFQFVPCQMEKCALWIESKELKGLCSIKFYATGLGMTIEALHNIALAVRDNIIHLQKGENETG